MKFVLFFVFLGFCESFMYYTPDTYPNSLWNPVACGLRMTGLACDPNHILGNHTAEELNILLKNVQYTTNCSCEDKNKCYNPSEGFTISVAVLNKISDDDTVVNATLEHRLKLAQIFADALRIRQDRGNCGDDILIVLSKSDTVIYTSLGSTASKYLTREFIRKVDKKVAAKLDNKEYFETLSEMILIYDDILKGKSVEEKLKEPWYHPLPLWAVWAIGGAIVFLLLLTILVTVFCCYKRRKNREYSVGRVNYNTRM